MFNNSFQSESHRLFLESIYFSHCKRVFSTFIITKHINLDVFLTTVLQLELVLVLDLSTHPSLSASPFFSCAGYPSLAAQSPPSSAQTRQLALVNRCLGIHTWIPTFFDLLFIASTWLCSTHDLGTQFTIHTLSADLHPSVEYCTALHCTLISLC